MFCKNCGNEVKDNAVVCISCGFAPLSEKNFCQHCGVKTDPKQVACIKCGMALGNTNSIGDTSKYKGLYRSSDRKIIAGVFGGIAHKIGITPFLMRFIVLLFVPFWVFAFLLYIIVAIASPALPTKDVVLQ